MGPTRAPSIAATHALRLAALVASRGVDLRLEVGRDDRMPIRQWSELLATATRSLEDPGLPFAFAQSVRLEDLEVLGFVVMTAENGLEALRLGLRLGRVFDESVEWRVEEKKDEISASFRREGKLDLGRRLANEVTVAEVIHALRPMGAKPSPLRVFFQHRPPDLAPHEAFFGVVPEVGARRDGFTIPRAWVSRRPRMASPALHAFFTRHAQELLARRSASTTVRDDVRAAILEGADGVARVAAALGCSERTLRRKLDVEGTTFRAVLEATRCERACELLADPRLSISEIAAVIGFANVGAFGRAFKRATKESPRDYRARRLEGGS